MIMPNNIHRFLLIVFTLAAMARAQVMSSGSVVNASKCTEYIENGKFTLADTIEGVVGKVSLGWTPTADKSMPLASFDMTRLIWTVEPSPTNTTKIYTYPDGLLQTTFSTGRNYNTLSFQPHPDILAQGGYTGEAGVLIQIAPYDLERLSYYKVSTVGSDRIQINDGFANFHLVEVYTSMVNSANKVPAKAIRAGQGLVMKFQRIEGTVKNNTDLGMTMSFKGTGMDVEAQLDTLESLSIVNVFNSNIKFKYHGMGKQGVRFIKGGSVDGCTSGCGLELFLAGPITNISTPAEIPDGQDGPMDITVNDPFGRFECNDILDPLHRTSKINCQLSTEKPTFKPFPCTTVKASYEKDVLYCDASNLDLESPTYAEKGYLCAVQGLPRPPVDEPVISSGSSAKFVRLLSYISWTSVSVVVSSTL